VLLFDDEAAKQIIERLTPRHFYNPHHNLIFAAAVRCYDEHGVVDVVLLAERLKADGNLEQVGGIAKMSMLAEAIATTAHLDQHMDTLDRLKRQRDLVTAHVEGLANILDADLDADAAMASLKEKLAGIQSSNGDNAYWRGTKYMRYSDQDPQWIVEPFIAPQDVFILSSDAGVGKTWFLVDMLLKIATQKPWLETYNTRKVRCLYADFDGHGDGDALRRRFRRIANGMGIHEPFDELDEGFAVMTRFHLPQAINLFKGSNLAPFKRAITDGDFKLVIIDTFASVHGSDNENDSGKMQVVMNRLREMAYDTGAAFALAHHHRKESQMGTDVAGSRYRGASSIKAGADSMLEMRREHSGIIRLSHAKPRHVKALPDFAASISDLDCGVVIKPEQEDSLLTARKDDAARWILNDLWKVAGVLPTEGIPQKNIIELAQANQIASDKYIREALKVLEARKLIMSTGQIGKTTVWYLGDRGVPEE
jgi:hypothetical protein